MPFCILCGVARTSIDVFCFGCGANFATLDAKRQKLIEEMKNPIVPSHAQQQQETKAEAEAAIVQTEEVQAEKERQPKWVLQPESPESESISESESEGDESKITHQKRTKRSPTRILSIPVTLPGPPLFELQESKSEAVVVFFPLLFPLCLSSFPFLFSSFFCLSPPFKKIKNFGKRCFGGGKRENFTGGLCWAIPNIASGKFCIR